MTMAGLGGLPSIRRYSGAYQEKELLQQVLTIQLTKVCSPAGILNPLYSSSLTARWGSAFIRFNKLPTQG